MKAAWSIGFCALLAAAQAWAQSPDPLFSEEAPAEDETSAESGRFYGDLTVRYDRVGSLNPLGGDTHFDRVRSRLRAGWRGTRGDFEYAIAGRINRSSDSNDLTLARLDNEKADDERLDEMMLRWHIDDASQLTVGKTALPLDLTPMVWDADFRPAGVSYGRNIAVGDFDRFSFVGGYFAPMHLHGDDSRLGALQAGYHWREGAPLSASVRLGYLHFSNLGDLTHSGLVRSNWREIIRAPGAPPPTGCSVCRGVTGPLVNDFRLVDLQGEVRWNPNGTPLVANLDLVHNLGADQDNDAARFSLTYGDAGVPGQFEYGAAFQRFQRDAVMAAFTDDDWWFHSNARGGLLRVGYGIDATWRVNLTYVKDRRDGPFRNGAVERFLFDVKAVW
jgi:hypothetical protein